jgi:acid phosphatase family membrane protein YuiD
MKAWLALHPWAVALLAAALVQFSKFLAHWIRFREPNFTRLVGTGGMPSAHSASVAALTTAVGFREGTTSTLFAVTLFLSLVIMHDAAGLRRAAGMQARVLNRIVEDHHAHRSEMGKRLNELVGHTPFEVLVGGILGCLFGAVWYL